MKHEIYNKNFLILVFGGAVTLLVLFLQNNESVTVVPVVSEETPIVTAAPVAVIPSAPSPPDREEKKRVMRKDDRVLVVRAIDGDTVEIEGGERVRYIGVNTPESVDPRRKVQCFGKEAKAYNKKLVEGQRVRLEPDVEDRDRYGRLLRYVWIGDTMINEQLVQDGYAQVMTIPPNVKYVERFRVAQTHARDQKLGLWDRCRR